MIRFLIYIFFICVINFFIPTNLVLPNINRYNKKETTLYNCKNIVDGYRFLLQTYEYRFEKKENHLNPETIEYINKLNNIIKKQERICNLSTNEPVQLLTFNK